MKAWILNNRNYQALMYVLPIIAFFASIIGGYQPTLSFLMRGIIVACAVIAFSFYLARNLKW